jgi:RNA polymerase sigma-54 factor
VVGNLDEDGYLLAGDEELLAGFVREYDPASAAPAGAASALLAEAVQLVQNLDPVGVATRSLRECLLVQIEAQRREFHLQLGRHRAASTAAQADSTAVEGEAAQALGAHEVRLQVFSLAARIVDQHLLLLQKRDLREMAKVLGAQPDAIQHAIDFIRSLDPRPGQRFNRSDARLIEPDVAFVKRGGEFVVVMNEEDLPTLRLNHGYRKLLSQEGTERDVKEYVKERYRSALQLMRNIEQRKNTILRTCEAIVRRQGDFLERGVDALKPMMIKEVAEEIGVHPSTVSRAVSSKYVHTSQGVFELRFFFSEGVHGPEGGSTPLMLLKRKVKKLIDEEDPRKPLTDDLIASMLEAQGIDVTRRTVAKYREDLRIPSTHQRRVRD